MSKIEDRIAKEVMDMVFYAMSRGLDTDKQNQEASVLADDTTKSILALISQVECGEQHDKEIRGLWCRKVDENKTGDWEMFNTKDGLYQICQKCKGTGYRRVMVRRDCSYCENVNFSSVVDGGECPICKDTHDVITLFTPDDLLDVIEGTATLELEGE